MLPILKREFIDSFKSIRTILIILFITIVSYQSAVLVDENRDLVNSLLEDGVEIGSVYTVAITMIILLLGFLFTFAISHDLINKEIELKTIRLLVTKVSRFEIVMGKLLGSFLFWLLVISASYGIIF